MSNADLVHTTGSIVAVERGRFVVRLDPGPTALCTRAGKLRHLQLVLGDRVDVALSPYNLAAGRITRRW